MSLSFLEIHNLRNINHTKIEPAPRLNIIFGKNASGKTSLLEGIYLLGLARSFRSHRAGSYIQMEQQKTTLHGKLKSEQSENITAIGFEKSLKNTELKLKGEKIRRVSEIAKILPIQILGPESHSLLDSGPSLRRKFLDWGVFHVEHNYFEVWKRYRRTLRQRNSALRTNPRITSSWDNEFCETAEQIDNFRREYLASLKPRFLDNLAQLTDLEGLKISYRRGWAKDNPLINQLKTSLERDKQAGYTGRGPHRADLVIEYEGVSVDQRLSRGQQKLVVYALKLAQASLFDTRNQSCLVLIDDLQSELDEEHRSRVLQLLSKTESQIFITATDANLLETSYWPEKKMFHVEHGNIQEVV